MGGTLFETLEKRSGQIFGSLTRRGVRDAIRMLLSANSVTLMLRPLKHKCGLNSELNVDISTKLLPINSTGLMTTSWENWLICSQGQSSGQSDRNGERG